MVLFKALFRELLNGGPGLKKIRNIMQREQGFELRDLLMEEEVVQETKANNQDLVSYIRKRENLIQMISYAVDMPVDVTDTDAI